MARRMPLIEDPNPWLHPMLTPSLLLAWIAASVAIFAAMCSSCPLRPPKPPPPSPSNESVSKTETSAPAVATLEEKEKENRDQLGQDIREEFITELDGQIHGPIGPTVLPVSASKRRLSISLSIGIPEGLNRIKTMKKERQSGNGGKGEESLWKKTIILGEKCRLQNAEGTETTKSSPGFPPATSFANRGGGGGEGV